MPRVTLFPSRLYWRICLTFSLLLLCLITALSWLVINHVETMMMADFVSTLEDKATLLEPQARKALLAPTSEAYDPSTLHTLADHINTRISVIDQQGWVVIDSDPPETTYDNHANRPEVIEALQQNFGAAKRFSINLNQHMLYVAKRVELHDKNHGVIRVALPLQRIQAEIDKIRRYIGVATVFAIFVALAAGALLTYRVIGPLTEMVSVAEAMRHGNFETTVQSLPNDEVGRLGLTLNRLGQDLQRLERVRRDFVANVSHEIKTPLTSIKGYVETLLSGAMDDPRFNRSFLEKIERNVGRLERLVQDILSLAKIEAQEGTINLTPTDWSKIIESVVARHEDTLLSNGIKLKLTGTSLPLLVFGDREAMTQVVDNLLSNAINYTGKGGQVSITLKRTNKHGVLEVEDTGIGIPAKEIHRVFERFYRVDKARSRVIGGTGLGLSIVKHLVSGMQGSVNVESTVGKGSKFTVSLALTSA